MTGGALFGLLLCPERKREKRKEVFRRLREKEGKRRWAGDWGRPGREKKGRWPANI